MDWFNAYNIPMVLLSIATVLIMATSDGHNLIWALSLASVAEALENNGLKNKQTVIRAVTFDTLVHDGLIDNFDLLDLLGNSEVTLTIVTVQMSLYIIAMDLSLLLGFKGPKRYATARTFVSLITTAPFIVAPLLAIVDGFMSGRAILIAFVTTEVVFEYTNIQVGIAYSIAMLVSAWSIRLLKFHFHYCHERLAVHNSYWVPGLPFRKVEKDGSRRDIQLVKVLRAVPVSIEEFILREGMSNSDQCCEPLGSKQLHRSISVSLNEEYAHLAVNLEKTDGEGTGLAGIDYTTGAVIGAIARELDFKGVREGKRNCQAGLHRQRFAASDTQGHEGSITSKS